MSLKLYTTSLVAGNKPVNMSHVVFIDKKENQTSWQILFTLATGHTFSWIYSTRAARDEEYTTLVDVEQCCSGGAVDCPDCNDEGDIDGGTAESIFEDTIDGGES